jgi:hypothetical protein
MAQQHALRPRGGSAGEQHDGSAGVRYLRGLGRRMLPGQPEELRARVAGHSGAGEHRQEGLIRDDDRRVQVRDQVADLLPLEFDCPLHYDRDAAMQAGFADVTMPYTAVMSWSIPPMWSPGDPPLFDDDARDAQPARSPINNPDQGPAPRTTGFFATGLEMDFLRPVTVGSGSAAAGASSWRVCRRRPRWAAARS